MLQCKLPIPGIMLTEVSNHKCSNEFQQCVVWIFTAVTANTLVHTVGISVTVARDFRRFYVNVKKFWMWILHDEINLIISISGKKKSYSINKT